MNKALLLSVATLLSIPAAHAAVITGVSASASSALVSPSLGFDRAASHTVDGSGQNVSGTTANSPADGTMWLDTGNGANGGINDTAPQITFNLGATYILSNITVYNYNEVNFAARGIASALLSTSLDGVNFNVIGPLSFNEAPGTTSAIGQIINVNLTAKFVELSNFVQFAGDDNKLQGLSEVTFSGTRQVAQAVPEPASLFCLVLVSLV